MKWCDCFHFIVEETEINLILFLPIPLCSRKDVSGRVGCFPKVARAADGQPDTWTSSCFSATLFRFQEVKYQTSNMCHFFQSLHLCHPFLSDLLSAPCLLLGLFSSPLFSGPLFLSLFFYSVLSGLVLVSRSFWSVLVRVQWCDMKALSAVMVVEGTREMKFIHFFHFIDEFIGILWLTKVGLLTMTLNLKIVE